MDIIKKLFCFNGDDTSAIGLCKFNDEFFKMENAKERFKKRIKKDATLSQILRRSV